MKFIRRVVMVLTIAIITTAWTSYESLAAEKEPLPSVLPSIIPVDNSLNSIESNANNLSPLSTQYIMSGYSSLELLSNSTFRVQGNTKAYIAVNSIKINLYLQQWNPSKGQWADILSLGSATNYNSNLVSYSKGAKVASGYYYRTRSQHNVVHNGIIEQFTSVSNQIYAR